MGLIYVQLILGGVMRHTESGLAIPDFPTVGWAWVPRFDAAMLDRINVWRFDADYDSVTMSQVLYHFVHRIGAGVVFLAVVWLNVVAWRSARTASVLVLLIVMDLLLVAQISLGAMTVLMEKQPHLTSSHVMVGAALLGISTLLLLRAAPLSWQDLGFCLRTRSSARERAVFSSGKKGEAGDVGCIVDGAGCSQTEKGPLEARSSFQTEP